MLPPGWVRISPYAIRNPPWTVCKVRVRECWQYELWHQGEDRRHRFVSGHHQNAEAAITAACDNQED